MMKLQAMVDTFYVGGPQTDDFEEARRKATSLWNAVFCQDYASADWDDEMAYVPTFSPGQLQGLVKVQCDSEGELRRRIPGQTALLKKINEAAADMGFGGHHSDLATLIKQFHGVQFHGVQLSPHADGGWVQHWYERHYWTTQPDELRAVALRGEWLREVAPVQMAMATRASLDEDDARLEHYLLFYSEADADADAAMNYDSDDAPIVHGSRLFPIVIE